MLSFCPNCKNMLVPKKQDDGQIVLQCKKCGYAQSDRAEIKLTQKIRHEAKEGTVIIDDPVAEASIEVECPNCNKVVKAAQWQVQTRCADDASTTFYRCSECGQTWRDYGG